MSQLIVPSSSVLSILSGSGSPGFQPDVPTWICWGLNQGGSACKADALQLCYGPSPQDYPWPCVPSHINAPAMLVGRCMCRISTNCWNIHFTSQQGNSHDKHSYMWWGMRGSLIGESTSPVAAVMFALYCACYRCCLRLDPEYKVY